MKKQIEHIYAFKNQMDSVSTDIKNIQKLLRDLGIQHPIRYFCTTSKVFTSDSAGTSGVYIDHFLLWDQIKCAEAAEWSLCYEQREQEGTGRYLPLFLGGGFEEFRTGQPKITIKKRLIEMNRDTRLEMYPYLEAFLDKICKSCKLEEFQNIQSNLLKKITSINQIVGSLAKVDIDCSCKCARG